MFAPVYLDHNATTPIDPLVLEAMLPFLRERFGNASSRHEYGRRARQAIDEARQRVAEAVNAHPTEVVFTSGGSEANNLFIKGAAATRKPGLIGVSAVEHPCVAAPARQLCKQGWELRALGVDEQGRIELAGFEQFASERPVFASIMLANNECGAIQDVPGFAARMKQVGAWLHTDAVQAFGKVPVDFRALGVNAMTLSSHKVYGPIGAGALVLDKRVELEPLIAGGGQERALRSGTENVAAIVGFGKACELAAGRMSADSERIERLRARLERGLVGQGVRVFAAQVERLPGTSFFSVAGIDGETLVGKLDRAGFAVASGSACSSANPEPSRTLMAMGVDETTARGAIRVSIGRTNNEQEVDDFLATFAQIVDQLGRLAAVSA